MHPVNGTYVNPKIAAIPPYIYDTGGYDTPAVTQFKEKLETFRENGKFTMGDVTLVSVSPFGPLGAAAAGFATVHAKITYKHVNNPKTQSPMEVPGLCFIRGDSAGMLCLLRNAGVDYVVFTQQARVPICDPGFFEIPAGMLNGQKQMTGFAAAITEEMHQEVGLDLDMEKDLKFLGQSYLSPGGSDEAVHLFFTRVHCSQGVLNHLEGKLGGLFEENEQITARIIPLSVVRQMVRDGGLKDAKLILSLAYYDSKPEMQSWACSRQMVMENEKPVMRNIPSQLETLKGNCLSFGKWVKDKISQISVNPPPLHATPRDLLSLQNKVSHAANQVGRSD